MKKLSFLDSLIFLLNSIVAFLLLASYLIPFVSPKITSLIAVMSLALSPLLICNFVFMLYWVLKLKKQFFLSFLILAIGYQYINAFIQFNETNCEEKGDLKLLSYNVRLFNIFEWTDEPDIETKIRTFVNEVNPDIICFQEYHKKAKRFNNYPYQFIKNNYSTIELAILSKNKIINKGSLEFKPRGNNAIFADIVVKKDTIRIYNLHLQSLQVNKNEVTFSSNNKRNLLAKFKKYFRIQATQVEQLIAHESTSPYKTIIMGDFNNTAFSWVYRTLKNDKNDAFMEAGSGFGKSFDYIFPFRIDYILAHPEIEIHSFKAYNKLNYSDHFPITASIHISN